MGLFGVKKPDLYAVIDLGSHALKGAVFERGKNSGIRVIKNMSYKIPLTLRGGRIPQKIREFLFEMVRSLGRIPKGITVAVGPHFGEQRIELWKIPEGAKISSPANLKSEFQKLFEGHMEENRAIIAHVLELYANGYLATSILSDDKRKGPSFEKIFKGVKEISFLVAVLSVETEIGTELIEAKRSLGGMPLEFIPRLAAYKEAFVHGLGSVDSFFIDAGGEETTLLFLKEGAFAKISCFPLGARHFLRKIQKGLDVSPDEAEEARNQYAKGTLGATRQKQVGDILREEKELWIKKFKESLLSFYAKGPLPPEVFLFGEGAGIPEIISAIKDPEWIKEFSYADAPLVKILDASRIFEGNTLGGLLKGPGEFNLASLVFFALHRKEILR